MPRTSSEEIALGNLENFFRVGATARSPGNIPTGHFELDFVINHGVSPIKTDLATIEGYDPGKALGVPLGKLVELFGEEGAGKSSLAYRLTGYAQKMGYVCAWIDAEQSFSENLAEINGVDRSSLLLSDMVDDENPENIFYAEDCFDKIVDFCKLKAKGVNVGLLVVDSVASLVPKARMEADAEKQQVGVLARLMSENIKKIGNYAAKYGVTVIFINQLREKIGVMFGNPETTPGGRTLKFQASLRIRVSKKSGKDANIYVKDEDGNDDFVGRLAYVRVSKNRFAPPYTEALEIPIYYKNYFPDLDDMMFKFARQVKLISYYKGDFKWKDIKVQTQREMMDAIKMSGDTDEFVIALSEKATEKGVILPPEISATVIETIEKIKKESKKALKDLEDGKRKTTKSAGTKKRKDSSAGDEDVKD